MGILLASFWGAIFLSKVTRISSFAQVTFSDPIVCRYGSGVGPVEDDDANSSDDGHEKAKKIDNLTPLSQSKLALPVLEFRVLNRLQGQKKGEIIDASMNIVASVDESQVAKSGASGSRIRRGKKGKTRRTVVKKPSKRTEDKPDGSKSQSSLIANLLGKSRRKIPLEDPTRSHMSRKSFAKLEIESQEHPFFKRVWVARHVLDQDSPLLQPGVKELIRLNQGHWPDELNNPEALRASIGFEQILVSLSGTSNADANSVYAQKVYDYVDLCFGYRFCNVLFRDETGLLIVDTTLFNDVVEQDGGGGEDLQNRALDNKMADIFIL